MALMALVNSDPSDLGSNIATGETANLSCSRAGPGRNAAGLCLGALAAQLAKFCGWRASRIWTPAWQMLHTTYLRTYVHKFDVWALNECSIRLNLWGMKGALFGVVPPDPELLARRSFPVKNFSHRKPRGCCL